MSTSTSTSTPGAASAVEFEDIQGLVRFGYGALTEASFLLLRIRDADAARAWLANAPVASAMLRQPPPRTALQIAFTSDGLRALHIPEPIIEGFSPEFFIGMGSDASRSRRLGDLGANAPSAWRWGGQAAEVPHVMLMLYALPGGLESWQQAILAQCEEGFTLMRCLPTSDMKDREPFGFRDGISQPAPDWKRERPVRDKERLDYGNLSCVGEFVLGYPNEYGAYTDRPLLPAGSDHAEMLPHAEEQPDMHDLGRNGSYLVLRQLRQHVGEFWRCLDEQAGGDAALRRRLAESMVGRTLDGDPLVGRTGERIAGEDDPHNGFTFRGDPDGLRCPLGAHIRRSNPRNADLPPGGTGLLSRLVRTLGFDAVALAEDHIASTRFHRLLRRGREYGPAISMQQALAGTAPAEGEGAGEGTGLQFICLNANIARQFEFVQGAWIAGTRFDRLSGESDPLLGTRQPGADGVPTDGFSMPQAGGAARRLTGLPPFVTVLGGAYFFLPGLRALRFLSKVQPS